MAPLAANGTGEACNLIDFPLTDAPLENVLAFGDLALDDPPAAAAGADPKMAEYESAKAEYQSVKKQMSAAQARLIKAMDALLKVPKATGPEVQEIMDALLKV